MVLYKADIWESAAGRKWYCNDTSHLGAGSGEWYLPARILGISPAEFIKLIINEFKADYCYYNEENNFFSYAWSKRENANRFKLMINRVARDKNFQI